MFDPNKITQTEVEFIRVYVRAMRREYSLLRSVLVLMHPEQLDMRCVVAATKAAKELQDLHAEFEQTIAAISTKHGMPCKKISEMPSADELSELFTLSFFKVVSPTPYGKKDAGWFSGEPGTLSALFKSLAKLEKEKLPNALATYFAAAFKLFSYGKNAYSLDDAPPNHWHTSQQVFKFYGHLEPQYDDDEAYDDDEDDDTEYWAVD